MLYQLLISDTRRILLINLIEIVKVKYLQYYSKKVENLTVMPQLYECRMKDKYFLIK